MRPRRAEAPTVPFSVYLSPDEIERLKRVARANNERPASFARDAILNDVEEALEEQESA